MPLERSELELDEGADVNKCGDVSRQVEPFNCT